MSPVASSRIEKDLLGTLEVPADAYYGIQTLRAVNNFRLSGVPLSHYPKLVVALAMVKQAAADANRQLGHLPEDKHAAISEACARLIRGDFHEQFVVDMIQGGAGTSTNMNANEVIANIALEAMGHTKGEYKYLHPNNDVNMAQSTNDAYPTAIRLGLLLGHDTLLASLDSLIQAFAAKGVEFAGVLKMGRTQLQDAVPMTLGQEFHAFATTLGEDLDRLRRLAPELLTEVNLGGTAIGTGINADPGYQKLAVERLAAISGQPLKPAADLIEATSDMGAFVLFSGMLKRTAVKLSKICNDLRLLSSGPRTGINEINLPPRQPGSSIMPGKVNPVIPEAVNQVAFEVIGNDLALTLAARRRPVATERDGAADRLQDLRLDPPAATRHGHAPRALHHRHHRQRRALPRTGRAQHRPGHRAEPVHRLRELHADRQDRPGERPRRTGTGTRGKAAGRSHPGRHPAAGKHDRAAPDSAARLIRYEIERAQVRLSTQPGRSAADRRRLTGRGEYYPLDL